MVYSYNKKNKISLDIKFTSKLLFKQHINHAHCTCQIDKSLITLKTKLRAFKQLPYFFFLNFKT